MISQKTKKTIILTSLASIGMLIACGGYYSPRVLNQENILIDSPPTEGSQQFLNNNKARVPQKELLDLPVRLKATHSADLEDLAKSAPNLPDAISEKYSEIRRDMIIERRLRLWGKLEEQRVKGWLDRPTLDALPKEFSLYLEGAVAYRQNQNELARTKWKEVLALPADQRKYKSTWAAWMLARTSIAEGEAMQWYEKVKELKKNGFAESLKITSKDWTSYIALQSGDYFTALDIYIKEGKEQITDPVSAASNISSTLYRMTTPHVDNPEELSRIYTKLAANKDSSLAVAYSYYFWKEKHLKLWIQALKKSKRLDIDQELGVCLIQAYRFKDQTITKDIIDNMKSPTINSLWIQAKLAGLKGDLAEASKLYSKVLAMLIANNQKPNDFDIYQVFNQNHTQTGDIIISRHFQIHSEYASVELGLKNYGKAIDLFIEAQNFVDAAYIAENILSSTELLAHVRKSKIAQDSIFLQDLLARKLMRNEYFKNAEQYISAKHQQIYKDYTTHYRSAINKELPVEQRVTSFIAAANIAAGYGRDLFYLENASRPYLRIYAAGQKVHKRYGNPKSYENTAADQFTPKISKDELNRIKQNYIRISPVSTSVRHGAELLYRAAMLLPKDSQQAAELFWLAGNWTRTDPQVADKYYQALIKKCFNTPLAKACDERRWFITQKEFDRVTAPAIER